MENEAKLFEKSFKNWKFLSNSQPDLPARIWVCWDPNFCDILMLQKSNQFIFVKVNVFDTDSSFFATFVYAENKHELRVPLFFDLKKIALNHASHPSISLGDFNVVQFSHEKMEGKEVWSHANEFFNSLVLEFELDDLCYKGCQFTWSNKRGGESLLMRGGLLLILILMLFFFPPGVSDHSPVVVHLGGEEAKFRKPFKFFDFWANHFSFLPRVHGVWVKYIRGSPMFRVCQKLKTLKPILKDLNKKEYSEISTRVGAAKDHLLNSQIKLDKDPMNLNLQETERAAYVKYVDLSKAEESLAHQKSRIQWLGLGDRNSKFFFRTVKGNVNKGRIHSVVLPNGDRVTKSAEVHNSFVDYFTNLFGKPFVDSYNGSERINGLITKRVSETQYHSLARELWVARNNRVFSKDMVPEEVVIKCIVDMVRFRVMHITNLKTNHTDRWYLSSWRLPNTMLKLAATDVYGACFPSDVSIDNWSTTMSRICLGYMVWQQFRILDGAAWFDLQFGFTRSLKLDMFVLMAAICASCVKIDFPLCSFSLECRGIFAYPCGMYTGVHDIMFPSDFCYVDIGGVHVPHQIYMRHMNTLRLLSIMLGFFSLVLWLIIFILSR
ncbi:hypothetical protein ACSBR2_042264 [Camellia fascicularis]